MSVTSRPLLQSFPREGDLIYPFYKNHANRLVPRLARASSISTIMWRNLARRTLPHNKAISRSFSGCSSCISEYKERLESRCCNTFVHQSSSCSIYSLEPSHRFHRVVTVQSHRKKNHLIFTRVQEGYARSYLGCSRCYLSVAEAVSSSTDAEEDCSSVDRVEKLRDNMAKESRERKENSRKHHLLLTRQVKIETEAWVNAANEYKELLEDMFEQKLAPNIPYVKTLFLGWFQPLRDAIANEQKLIRDKGKKPTYASGFDQLPADMMAVITMHKLMSVMMTADGHGTARVVGTACTIGDAIEQEVRIYTFLERTKRKRSKKGVEPEEDEASLKDQHRLREKVKSLIRRQRMIAVRNVVKGQVNIKPWSVEMRAKVGTRLLELLLETAYIQSPNQSDTPPDVRPAFVHTFSTLSTDNKNSKRYGVIKSDPLIIQGLHTTARHMVIPYMPMLVPPVRWTGYDKGAHLFLPCHVMRTHGAKQQKEALKRVPRSELKSVFEALDTLGSTKWRINKRVLGIIERIWNSGGCLGDLVDRSDIPLPDKPDTDDEDAIKKWKSSVRSAKKVNGERHSLRCDIDLKLSVARKLKDEEGFYYPHNIDFRGRAYPMHPYLNHLGSDVCRGILEFSEGRPLGKSGLKWLKIQIANLVGGGVDKLSYDGRLAFTESHVEEIFDSAERPLEGNRWWLAAEDPFQCLAACMNLTEALKSSSPEAYVSHIPIHMDGSCNGLQHYAALGRDKLGAAAVNLVAGDKPADVYSGIAARVLDIMRRDAKKDPELFPDSLRAKLLLNEVDRKLVKQTVMTSVYGVTYIGARDQIKRRLKERGTISDDEIFGASCYAAKVTLTALGEMFEAARAIMNWLGDCAKIIASENEPVRWKTPLGLPVVQPYRSKGVHSVKTSLQILSLKSETDKVLAKRQRTAFPPNFVHSLDGSHMMMTAVACKKAGLHFAGVHDSYWTHARDVDRMNRILREKFVELYETPILENLLRSFEESFPSLQFPPLPERGDFELREVLNSPYFFN